MEKREKVFIYALIDPKELKKNHIYIGKTYDLNRRYNAHLKDKNKTYKVSWIKSLLKRGLKPEIIVLDQCENVESVWEEKERSYIKFYRDSHYIVVNTTDGGEGGHKALVNDYRFCIWIPKWMKKDL